MRKRGEETSGERGGWKSLLLSSPPYASTCTSHRARERGAKKEDKRVFFHSLPLMCACIHAHARMHKGVREKGSRGREEDGRDFFHPLPLLHAQEIEAERKFSPPYVK